MDYYSVLDPKQRAGTFAIIYSPVCIASSKVKLGSPFRKINWGIVHQVRLLLITPRHQPHDSQNNVLIHGTNFQTKSGLLSIKVAPEVSWFAWQELPLGRKLLLVLNFLACNSVLI